MRYRCELCGTEVERPTVPIFDCDVLTDDQRPCRGRYRAISTRDLFDLAEAEERKTAGQDLVEGNAFDFVPWARAYAETVARRRPDRLVTVDDIREEAARRNIAPHNKNAWGAVFRGACWQPVGMKKSTFKSNHAHRITIWRLVEEAAA